jgi:hypothetical protein
MSSFIIATFSGDRVLSMYRADYTSNTNKIAEIY